MIVSDEGDIAEWREVKIGMKGAPGSFYSLGFPDHTAIIVIDSIDTLALSQRWW